MKRTEIVSVWRRSLPRHFPGALFILMIGWLAATPLSAQTPQAWIVDIQPRTASVPLTAGYVRNGVERRALLMEPLYAGDVLFTRSPEAKIVVELPDRVRRTIDSAANNYSIEGASNAFSKLVSAFSSNMRWSNSAQLTEVQRPMDSIGRGEDSGPLELFKGVRDPLKLTATPIPLWLGWRGGKPPFRIEIVANGEVVAKAAICSADKCVREAIIALPQPMPAAFTITVSDAAGSKVDRQAVVAASDLGPPAPSTDDIDRFTAIVAMVDRGGGRAWSLEAARALAPIATTFPAARAMLDGFRDGLLP